MLLQAKIKNSRLITKDNVLFSSKKGSARCLTCSSPRLKRTRLVQAFTIAILSFLIQGKTRKHLTIYIFALDGEVYVKMLSFKNLTNVISIFSAPVSIDKPELLTKIENDPANSDRFHIFGRVLALLRGSNVIQHKF